VIRGASQIQLTYLYKQTTEVLKSIANTPVILNTQAIKKHVGETKNLVVRDTLQIQPTYFYKQTAEAMKNIANALIILNARAFKKHVGKTNNLVA
jgi:hypothetical protein